MTALRTLRERALWPVDAFVDFFREWLRRFFDVQGFDRAMAIGAYAYSALIPAVIVYSAAVTDERSFADELVKKFDLSGSTADSIRAAFGAAPSAQSGVTAFGVLLLIVAGLSFARAMQRLYENAYGLPPLSMRNTKWALLWLLLLGIAAEARPHLDRGPVTGLLLSAAVWLATPYLLLGRRVHWSRLIGVALLSALGMSGVGIYTVIYMPHAISDSAQQYGVFGIGFALLSWLFVSACVLVAAATGGAMITERIERHQEAKAA
jgi:membrane protein